MLRKYVEFVKNRLIVRPFWNLKPAFPSCNFSTKVSFETKNSLTAAVQQIQIDFAGNENL